MIKHPKNEFGIMKNLKSGFSSFHFEGDRSTRGLSVRFSCVVGVSEYSDEQIVLNTHLGRISVFGKRLRSLVFENNIIEISGRIEGIEFSYGKN